MSYSVCLPENALVVRLYLWQGIWALYSMIRVSLLSDERNLMISCLLEFHRVAKIQPIARMLVNHDKRHCAFQKRSTCCSRAHELRREILRIPRKINQTLNAARLKNKQLKQPMQPVALAQLPSYHTVNGVTFRLLQR